jgi:hypothetical protein
VALLGAVAIVAGVALVWILKPTGPRARLLDEAGVLAKGDVVHFEAYLTRIHDESDVDIRMVFVRGLGGRTIEEVAVERVAALGIGRASGRERGTLLLYDVGGKQLRVEVGYGLEEHFPDALVAYLMREHARAFFAHGAVSTGLLLTLRMLHDRICSAILRDAFDPQVLATLRRHRGHLSGGAGASAPTPLGSDPAAFARARLDDVARASFAPQPTPQGTYDRYLEWLARGRFDPALPMFTPPSQRLLAGLPVSPAYFDWVLMREYGSRFVLDARGDLALLYCTSDPLVGPHLFRRTPDGWQMDIVAEVQNTRNIAGGVFAWDWRGAGDDFSRAFADKLVTIGGYVRIADGDNRQLPTRR